MRIATAHPDCPFCEAVRTEEPLARRGTFVARYDSYPVSRGHVLLIPRRHIATFFELNRNERSDFFNLLLEVRDILHHQFQPDGFNIGVNVGPAAGQTIMHLHVHVIPRYAGDVEHPEGGVRNILPNLAQYLPNADTQTSAS